MQKLILFKNEEIDKKNFCRAFLKILVPFLDIGDRNRPTKFNNYIF